MKLIVLSIDALGYSDIKNNPECFTNFNNIMKEGTLIKNVETIYPSITYPIHTSIITGEYPSVHGIDHNVIFEPFSKYQKWNWYYKNIQCKTIIDVLNENNKKTTSILWPVTAGAKISRNLPEIWDYRTGKLKASLIIKYGTINMIKTAYKHSKHLNGKDTVALDKFSYNILCDQLDNLNDLTLVHFLAVDGNKHVYGENSAHARKAFCETDKYIGKLYEKIRAMEDVTLAIVSDHSQKNVSEKIEIEELFKKNGLIFKDDYIAYPHSSEGSCYVYIKNDHQIEQIKTKLASIVGKHPGIDYMVDLSEEKNVSSKARFILEAKENYYFYVGSEYAAVHGYHPKIDDYSVFMLCSGKGIKKDHVIDNGNIINHAKTFAKILDIDYPYGDGECIVDVFEKV